ncbi:MAG: MFS transporter [Actinomycetota bacterium]
MASHPYRQLLGSNRDFRRLWSAQLISLGGDWFNVVALTGLALHLTGSSFYGGAILAASFIPQFLATPLTGVIADRFGRRRLMLGANLAGAVLALTMLAVRSPGTLWLGLAAMAGLAVTGAVFDPASRAGLPNVVSGDDLGAANALMGSTWGIMAAVGAGVGGLVAALIGRDAAFLVNAVSFLVSAALILGVGADLGPAGAGARSGRLDVAGDLREAVAWARSEPRALALLGQKAGYGLGTGMIGLLPFFAAKGFGASSGSDAGIGILYAARGLGTLIGPFIARPFVRAGTHRLFPALTASMLLYGLAYMIFPSMPGIWMAAAVVVAAHLGGGTQNTLTSYGLQQLAPDGVRGRILAFELGLITASMAASLLVAGWASELVAPRAVVEVLAAVMVTFAVVWGTVTRRLWRAIPVKEATCPEKILTTYAGRA